MMDVIKGYNKIADSLASWNLFNTVVPERAGVPSLKVDGKLYNALCWIPVIPNNIMIKKRTTEGAHPLIIPFFPMVSLCRYNPPETIKPTINTYKTYLRLTSLIKSGLRPSNFTPLV